MKKILILFFAIILSGCETTTVEPFFTETNTSDATTGHKLKLLSPNGKESSTVTYSIHLADTAAYDYLATVVPLSKGYYLELGKGRIKGNKHLKLHFNSNMPLTKEDGFYLYLFQNGNNVGYYRVNSY